MTSKSDTKKNNNCILQLCSQRGFESNDMVKSLLWHFVELGLQNSFQEKVMVDMFLDKNKSYFIQFKNEHFAEYVLRMSPFRYGFFVRHKESSFQSQPMSYDSSIELVYGSAQSVYDINTLRSRRVYIVPQSEINNSLNELQLAKFINEWYEQLNLCKIPGIPPVLFVHLDGKHSFVEMRRYVDGVSFLNFNGFVFKGIEFSIVSSRAHVWYNYRFQFYNWKELIEMKTDDLHLGMDLRLTSVVVMVHYQGSRKTFENTLLDEIEETRKRFESLIDHNCILDFLYADSPEMNCVRYFVETSTIEQARQLMVCFRANELLGDFIEYYDEKKFAIGSLFEPCLVYFLSKRCRK